MLAHILVGKLQAWIALACVDFTVHNTDDPFPGILVSNRTVRNGFRVCSYRAAAALITPGLVPHCVQ